MIKAHYFAHRNEITHNRAQFWLRELRTALLLIETAKEYPSITEQMIKERPLLQYAKEGKEDDLNLELERGKKVSRIWIVYIGFLLSVNLKNFVVIALVN